MDEQANTGFAQKCADVTKYLFMLTVVTAIMIIIFMFSPVSNLLVAASLGKVTIVALLVYIIYVNVLQTGLYQETYNINVRDFTFSKGELIATYSHIFTIVLIVLLYSVVSNLFSPLFGGSSQSQTEYSSSYGYNQ